MASETAGIYSEEGGRWFVTVLSDVTTERDGHPWRTVRLRCRGTIRPSPVCKDIPEGEEWEATTRIGSEHYVGWDLEIDDGE